MNRSSLLVECVPNFSEGRNASIVDMIVTEIRSAGNIFVLDREMDASHNRAVITLVGEGYSMVEGMFRGIRKARELINLSFHKGEHPRAGATDVVPFIPIANTGMCDCVELSKILGERVGKELQIPVFLYENSATRPERRNLSFLRNLQFEGLRDMIGKDPEKKPDFGPDKIHPTAGATFIGAREFLIAYNIYLDTDNVAIAKNIAKKIREKDGGLPCVKALGFWIEERKCAQVSMNLTNYKVTSIKKVFDEVTRLANELRTRVTESEIVGLVPEAAIKDFSPSEILIKKLPDEQILEYHLRKLKLI